jgi:alanine racemase
MTSFNRVDIDITALQDNFASIRKRVGAAVKVMAVVKSDAYGHGMLECSKALFKAGARTFGVAEVWEGVALRRAGLSGDIVVLLGGSPETFQDIVRHDLTPIVFDADTLDGLSQQADRMKANVGIHLKVDVGMGRLGVRPEEVEFYMAMIRRLPGVFPAGILSHFPIADEPEGFTKTRQQFGAFQDILAKLQNNSPGKYISHIANSAALMYFPATHLDMVRPGISLYGCYPDGSPARGLALQPAVEIRPVMSFKTRVIQVKEVGTGCGISYGHTFVTSRPSRFAVLPVGYANGYLRSLSNKAEVLINGRRAPVCGRVCMNACLVDITDLPPVQTGDEAVLMGKQGAEQITADEIAGWMDTISYEVLCLFGSSNERAYVNSDTKT